MGPATAVPISEIDSHGEQNSLLLRWSTDYGYVVVSYVAQGGGYAEALWLGFTDEQVCSGRAD